MVPIWSFLVSVVTVTVVIGRHNQDNLNFYLDIQLSLKQTSNQVLGALHPFLKLLKKALVMAGLQTCGDFWLKTIVIQFDMGTTTKTTTAKTVATKTTTTMKTKIKTATTKTTMN